jgi:hypothetical protein
VRFVPLVILFGFFVRWLVLLAVAGIAYNSAITIRTTDGVTCSIMERNATPSVLMNLVKVAVCGSGG